MTARIRPRCSDAPPIRTKNRLRPRFTRPARLRSGFSESGIPVFYALHLSYSFMKVNYFLYCPFILLYLFASFLSKIVYSIDTVYKAPL
jgi:hypothetical protein